MVPPAPPLPTPMVVSRVCCVFFLILVFAICRVIKCVLFLRINRNKALRNKEKEEDKREGEEIQKLVKLHQWEQKKLEEVKRQEKQNLMKSYREHQSNK